MKALLISFICLRLFISSSAQTDSCGIYLTVVDFRDRKLTDATNCKLEKPSIRVLEFWRESKHITIRYHKVKYKYLKRDLFGFRDCSNNDYRFYMDVPYEVLSREYIILYRYADLSQSEDVFDPDLLYFFSQWPDSEIYPLSRRYLKWAYKENQRFVGLLDSLFQDNDDLLLFNKVPGEYRLISIYRQTLDQRAR